jgi:pyruvoyl-dependent arginine decarboxylase (PvlArgDC)
MERFLHFGLELKYPEKHIKLVKQARGTPIDWSIGAVVFAMTANSHIHAPGEPVPHSSTTTLAPAASQSSSSTEGDSDKCSATGPCESSQTTTQSAASSWFDSQMHKLLLLACGSAIAAVIMHCIQRDRHYRGCVSFHPASHF